jgi:hypothetical protein
MRRKMNLTAQPPAAGKWICYDRDLEMWVCFYDAELVAYGDTPEEARRNLDTWVYEELRRAA